MLKTKILELLFRLTDNKFQESSPYRYYEKRQVEKIKDIREYMINNVEKKYRITELSEQFDIAMTSLKECFKEVYGAPISVYMREYRMSLAEKHIRESDYSIAEIADRIGYENQSKFTEMFKKMTGMTPIEYRNKRK